MANTHSPPHEAADVPAEPARDAGPPATDDRICAEARRLLDAAAARGVPLRLVGGLAVRLHAAPLHPALTRAYKDIDLVTLKACGAAAGTVLEAAGYTGAAEFNALNGHRRLMYVHPADGRQVDVFVGEFAMCHRIPVTERIERDPLTLPLAELLLTKLQIVELNERDVLDAAALLLAHDVDAHDDDAINGDRVAELCAADWGLWRTVGMNLDRIGEHLDELALRDGERRRIRERSAALRRRIEAEPKPARWRMRDRIGDRKRWYELPEETG